MWRLVRLITRRLLLDFLGLTILVVFLVVIIMTCIVIAMNTAATTTTTPAATTTTTTAHLPSASCRNVSVNLNN